MPEEYNPSHAAEYTLFSFHIYPLTYVLKPSKLLGDMWNGKTPCH